MRICSSDTTLIVCNLYIHKYIHEANLWEAVCTSVNCNYMWTTEVNLQVRPDQDQSSHIHTMQKQQITCDAFRNIFLWRTICKRICTKYIQQTSLMSAHKMWSGVGTYTDLKVNIVPLKPSYRNSSIELNN